MARHLSLEKEERAMTPVLLKSFAAMATVAGLALTTVEGTENRSAYDGQEISRLTRSDIKTHAMSVFMRADIDNDQSLSADEYTALSIVTAELAHLNGFIVVESGGGVSTAALPPMRRAALTQSEQIRIEAVSRRKFYVFSGDDGAMDAREFSAAQIAMFDAADFNNNGVLAKRELNSFAQRQALMTIEA
jgi:hypothetical protein